MHLTPSDLRFEIARNSNGKNNAHVFSEDLWPLISTVMGREIPQQAMMAQEYLPFPLTDYTILGTRIESGSIVFLNNESLAIPIADFRRAIEALGGTLLQPETPPLEYDWKVWSQSEEYKRGTWTTWRAPDDAR